MMRNLCFTVTALFVFGVAHADFSDRVKEAMQSDLRTEREIARDANRKPAETLAFFGITESMKVLELVPGGGWYTKILAPALKEEGEFYVAIGTNRVKERLLVLPEFKHVNLIEGIRVSRPEGSRFSNLDSMNIADDDFDAVLTFRNLHNFSAQGRAAMNKGAFDALRPGGIYGVVDHTRRHMEGGNDENRRRLDPVLTIKEIVDAGFEFVDFSDLHYKAADELDLEVGHDSVTGKTDRFTLLFRKPTN
ncbi:MAG: methyltransferase [Pseudomonadota bacterium]